MVKQWLSEDDTGTEMELVSKVIQFSASVHAQTLATQKQYHEFYIDWKCIAGLENALNLQLNGPIVNPIIDEQA